MNQKHIKSILKQIREELQCYAIRNHRYYGVRDLNCMCGIGAYLTFSVLKRFGYDPVFHMNSDHCFVTLDGYWLDVTLTQFDAKCPTVWFKRKPYAPKDWRGKIHVSKHSAKTEAKIKRLFRGWPRQQNPFRLAISRKLDIYE